MLAGQGPDPIIEGELMLVLTSPTEQEASDSMENRGMLVGIRDQARYLKGPVGLMLKDVLGSVNLDTRKIYTTSLIKWLLPKAHRYSPTAAEIAHARDCLDRELCERKPSIVVTFGKAAFEAVSDIRMPFDTIMGGVFWSEEYNCRVVPLEHPYNLEKYPDYIDRFRIYFKMIKQLIGHDGLQPIQRIPLYYRVIRTAQELRELVALFKRENRILFAPDCEWGGGNHVDGQLRSLQLCWQAGYAAYIRFMDDKGNYAFDVSYAEAGKILSEHLDQPYVKYVGHHISADLPWMSHVLGLQWFGKTIMDTEFAMQTVDEHQPHGLEWLAVKYTDLGRYDIPLEMHKREIKLSKDEGYGRISDEIMIPSGLNGESRIVLANGSSETIRELVRQKYSGKVRVFDGNGTVEARVVGWFRHAVRRKKRQWFRLGTVAADRGRWGFIGPGLTLDHKVLTRRGAVPVASLVAGQDAIATEEMQFSNDQLSIFLGSLLGDGGYVRKNGNRVGFCFGQCYRRKAYAFWKARAFSTHKPRRRRLRRQHVQCELPFSRYIASLSRRFVVHERSIHWKRQAVITPDILENLGWLGLAVWYQDDGTLVKDRSCRIYAKRSDQSELTLAIEWIKKTVNDSHVSYNQKGRFIQLTRGAYDNFFAGIRKFIHPVMQYKCPLRVEGEPTVCQECMPYYEPITDVVPYRSNPKGSGGDGVVYGLAVENHHNILTQIGFVAARSPSSACQGSERG